MKRYGGWRRRAAAVCAGAALWSGGCAVPPAEVAAETEALPVIPPAEAEPPRDAAALYTRLAMLGSTMELLKDSYADADRATYERMMTGALKGMLRELDPYSTYDPPRELRSKAVQLTGETVGIGINIVKNEREPILVVGVVPGSPAEEAGIRVGDRVVRLNGRSTPELTFEDCRELVVGAPDSELELRLVRAGGDNAQELRVRRRKLVIEPIPASAVKRLPGDIGYLRIDAFNRHTAAGLDRAIAQLRAAGPLRGLILDLRNNTGGMVSAAVNVCSRFLPAGRTVFWAEGRKSDEAVDARTHPVKQPEYTLPLAVLVNQYSASAAEIVAGCLQDHRRAVTVGVRTFGKGSIQRMHQLDNGGAIRYTIAHYRTPGKHLIQARGVSPEITVGLSDRETSEMARQSVRHPGEIRPDGPGAIVDRQLERALELLRSGSAEAQP